MALLRHSIGQDSGPIIRGRKVVLRAPSMNDYVAWAELRAVSRDHLMPWEPLWSRDELTRTSFRRRVRHYQREAREDLGHAFFIFAGPGVLRAPVVNVWGQEPSAARLAGGITLSNIRRGVTQAATLGYWIGAPYTRQGLMRDALIALVPFAFDVLRLHRLEAAVMPENAASIALLEGIGFVREGRLRRYLRIGGRWRDHDLYALLPEDTGRDGGGGA